MAYDTELAARIQKLLAKRDGIIEKRMFGGTAFMLNGNMACGVNKNDLIVRIDPDDTTEALAQKGVKPFDLTGRPMKGWIVVTGATVKDAAALRKWVNRGLKYAGSLPAK